MGYAERPVHPVPGPPVDTPAWVKDAVFYQIFPDRFARSPRTRHPPGLHFKPWGSSPQEQGYQGGDLRGIVDRLDYLRTLGVDALYLTPIFAAAANHRYHTYDYFQVDPLLGGNGALRELLDQAHRRQMRVVLDGVFNHTGRGFWAFHHILENSGDSPYIDWFHIEGWPLRAYHSDGQSPANYRAWCNLPMLPKLNTAHPAVQEFILEVARHWLEFGADGWRLDVPFEIDDAAFWRQFRRVVKTTNPEAYLVGEFWGPAQPWLQGDQFDGMMNYPLARLALCFFGAHTLRPDYHMPQLPFAPLTAPAFGQHIDALHDLYAWPIQQAQLNVLDSHDTARALWIVGEDKSALRLCVLFQMTMPGAPCIYYGDEIGLSSRTDPDCRAAFPWNREETWDRELLDFYCCAVALRRRYPVLRTGTFEALYAADEVYAFSRRRDGQEAVVVLNAAGHPVAVALPRGLLRSEAFVQVWPEQEDAVCPVGGTLPVTLPARAGRVLIGR